MSGPECDYCGADLDEEGAVCDGCGVADPWNGSASQLDDQDVEDVFCPDCGSQDVEHGICNSCGSDDGGPVF